MNKLFYLICILALLGSCTLNHKRYGNSNSTLSQYEIVEYQIQEQKKKKIATAYADYIYSRIETYQMFDDKPRVKLLLLWDIYNYGTTEYLKEGLKNEKR